MKENSLLIRHRMPLLLLAFFAIIVLRMPIAVFADISMNFRVTISYDVENDHDGEENKIIVYYWNPSETGYTYDDSNHATIGKVAFKEGDNRSVSVNLPGPPASMEVYFHGSLTDKVEYYVNKVEVEALNPVPGNDRAKKVTLWEGILGCSVATTFSNTISNRLYFNSPDSGSFPYFQGWRDPGTGREAVFGDDKETITSDYYKDGCRKPAAVGRVGFLTDLPDSLPIPRDNMPASYTISVKDGELYDCYGAPWPNQPSEGSLSVSPDNKHLQLKKLSEDKWTLTINPNSNEAEDYRLTLTHTKEGTEETATSTLQSFDYNYTFLDEYGAVIETRSVNYGASVDPPYSGARTVTWCCDAYSDWKKTNDGPQDRTVYRKPLLEGDGSQSTPALIKTADDWDKLQAIVQNGASKEKHFRLENNISVTETIGTSQHPFEGLFDGNGKVLTIHYSNVNNEERTAPFAYARNATISNLTVNGSIDGSADHAAGILGENDGTTLIKKCTVSAAIKGGAYVGGFSIGSGGNLSIEDSVFDGMLNGTNNCGGFVAWGTNTLVLRNCTFAPLAGTSIESGATFANNQFKKIIDCVYYTELGKSQALSYDRSTADSYKKEAKKTETAQELPKIALSTKFVAGNKSFKAKTKTKKYTVTLKDQNNKAVKNVKLSLKVKGKQYTAKTNANGKATFRIKNLKKKGKYKATLSFGGNKDYKVSGKTVVITVK